MLEAGDPAPDFYLPAADDPGAEYMLSAAADAGPVVVAFVSDVESTARPLLKRLAGVEWAQVVDRLSVFGIGTDEDALARLAEGVPFPVLYDRGGYVTDLYGVDQTSRSDQAIVVADSRCVIRFAWDGADAAELPLEAVQSAVAEATE
ncbi:Peroxiredoxin [Halapricum desulfuricans]|uniref:Peroxiredoxin n=1 Tax=Halapricum desulfuricans TaxID=2841257 RepID=A0A897NIT8_9EURY|nr:redoxin family protein [Halapricum desulfuricans]QSG10799.1 Peroxiredoxin [Halapricum desulfuricans]